MDRQVDLAGNLLSPDQAKVSSEVAGVVQQVLVEIGTEVRAGQPLVRLDSRELDLALASAESALKQAYAQLGVHGSLREDVPLPPDEQVASVRMAVANRDHARANYERSRTLASRGLIAPTDLQTTETQMKVAEANYQAAFDTVRAQKAVLQDKRAQYALALKKVQDATVKAPIAGVVSERTVQQGEFIVAHTPVATVVQVNPLKLRTGVQERYAGAIRVGQRVEFHVASFGDAPFAGTVAYVSPSIDQTMRAFTVEALVDNRDRRLKPGFFAKGVIYTTRDDNVMAVPDEAVSTLAGVSSVFVVDRGKIRQVSVTLGARQGGVREVLDGLHGDEVLASSNLNQLATGVAVKAAGAGHPDRPARPPQGGGPRGGRS